MPIGAPLSRAASTAALTNLVMAWLWHSRDCRVLALEVGATAELTRLTQVLQGRWRVDVSGASNREKAGLRVDVVEVKGSRADLLREPFFSGKESGLNKWAHSLASPFALWLAASHDIREEDLSRLPAHWGILRARADARALSVVRKPAASGIVDGQVATGAAFTLAQYSQAACLPAMGRSIQDAVEAMNRGPGLAAVRGGE